MTNMTNPHFVVGTGRRCICGNYGGEDITCADIGEDVEGFAGLRPMRRIRKVLWSLREECKDPVILDKDGNDSASGGLT